MTDTATIIDEYNAAFLERAPERLIDLVASDGVMEGTGPALDGDVWTGYDECLAGWQGLASDPTITFEVRPMSRLQPSRLVSRTDSSRRCRGEDSNDHRQRQWGLPGHRVLR